MWRWPPSRAVSRASRRRRSQAAGPAYARERDAAVEREVVREPDVLGRAAAELALQQVAAGDHARARSRRGAAASGEASVHAGHGTAVRGQRAAAVRARGARWAQVSGVYGAPVSHSQG